LVGLARRYNIDARSLALLNRMAPPYVLRPGEQLVLPAFARAPARSSTPAPMVASNAPDNAGKKEQSPPPAPPAPPAGPVRFAWPLEGKVLARFGPQAGGRRSDGLDIAVTAGAPVQAAADGRVVYAGAELPGYGRLILIQHEGEWVTAYAHLGAFGAAEGARVKQGERIGTASGEKLHFQVRRRGEPTDPTPLLPNV
jgi:murein DD-endopeptidase MepM/ murein hydrolase activator NlpD